MEISPTIFNAVSATSKALVTPARWRMRWKIVGLYP